MFFQERNLKVGRKEKKVKIKKPAVEQINETAL